MEAKQEGSAPIRITQLAARTSLHKNSINNSLKSRGFMPFKIKDGRNQPLYVTSEDADSFLKMMEEERELGYSFTDREKDADSLEDFSISAVYAIHIPSFENTPRLKIGWSDNLQQRLKTHRSLLPDLRIVGVWPTPYEWLENTALLWARVNGKQISTEVFEFDDIDEAITRLNHMFAELGIAPEIYML